MGEVQSGEVTATHLRGANLLSITSGTSTSYYLFNAHGDVAGITDDAQTVTNAYEYDAFGNEKNPSATDTNPFRYCGEYFDTETGTYYLRARYYDPAIGRFTQQDIHWNTANMIYGDNSQKTNESQDALGLKIYTYAPSISSIMQSGNLYVYCVNNPITFTDDTGCALRWPGEIHNAVVKDIKEQYKSDILDEVWLIKEDGTLGRADLVDKDGRIWKIKSRSYATHCAKATEKQISNYVGGKLINHGEIPVLSRGNNYIVGRTFKYTSKSGALYEITYENAGKGLIVYDYVKINNQQYSFETADQSVVTTVLAIISVFVLVFTNGAYAPTYATINTLN